MEKTSTVETGISSYPDLEGSTAIARIQWAKNTYGDSLVMSTSFGIQAAVMLHLVTSIVPNIPKITGKDKAPNIKRKSKNNNIFFLSIN